MGTQRSRPHTTTHQAKITAAVESEIEKKPRTQSLKTLFHRFFKKGATESLMYRQNIAYVTLEHFDRRKGQQEGGRKQRQK